MEEAQLHKSRNFILYGNYETNYRFAKNGSIFRELPENLERHSQDNPPKHLIWRTLRLLLQSSPS